MITRFPLHAALLMLAASTTTILLAEEPVRCKDEKAGLLTRTYAVADLVSARADGRRKELSKQLIQEITNTIAPDSWAAQAGPAVIEYFPLGMTLVIRQTPDNHERIADLLATMRERTGAEESSEPAGERGKLKTLLEKYEEACASGDNKKARKCARKALQIDPTCFCRRRTEPDEVTPSREDEACRSNPTERMEALLVNSENYRQIKDEWKRFWFVDQPSHMTFDRIHGGIEETDSPEPEHPPRSESESPLHGFLRQLVVQLVQSSRSETARAKSENENGSRSIPLAPDDPGTRLFLNDEKQPEKLSSKRDELRKLLSEFETVLKDLERLDDAAVFPAAGGWKHYVDFDLEEAKKRREREIPFGIWSWRD